MRRFTWINMTISQVLKTNLTTLKEAPKNPNTASPRYNPNARCAYHSESPGHDTNDCWALKNKVQDLINAKEIEFDLPELPNVITTPMPRHGQGINAINDDRFVSFVNDLITPLLTIKQNLLQAGLFPGCHENCHLCKSLSNGCLLLKIGV